MPPLRERFEWLEDTLQMAYGMWSGGCGSGGRVRGQAGHRHAPAELAAGHQPAAGADHDRRRRGAEDAAPGGAVRRRLQRLRRPGVDHAQIRACCASTASGLAAPTTRSSARTCSASTSTASRTDAVVDRFGELGEAGCQHVIFSVRGVADTASSSDWAPRSFRSCASRDRPGRHGRSARPAP